MQDVHFNQDNAETIANRKATRLQVISGRSFLQNCERGLCQSLNGSTFGETTIHFCFLFQVT